MQTAEVIAAVPAVAPIADELMRAAGYVVPTPAGVDPNFPQPGAADSNLGIKDVANKRTGMVFTPGDATVPPPAPAQPDMAPSTTLRPMPPGPADSSTGQRHGIQTVRSDSTIAGAAMADGGRVAGYGYADGGTVHGVAGVHPVDDALSLYDQFSQQHPNLKLAADTLPYSNVVSSGLDVANDLNKGEYWTAAGDALGLIPGFRLAKSMLPPSMIGRVAELASQYRRPIDAAVNALPEYVNKLAAPAQAAPAQQQPIQGYAEGGLIAGPGTGTSDSIPAAVGSTPLAVSNGEYRIPAAVVAALGQDFFDKIIAQFHAPAGPPGAPPEASAGALPLENGDFIIPADVVEQLGADFFDKLVELYGGAQ
jgi:hypothetical protein